MKVKLNGNDWYQVSADYGAIDSVHKTPHQGVDLVMNTGTDLHSPADGIITNIVDYGNKSIGKGIIIKTDDNEKLILGHMSDNSQIKVGQEVDKGDFLGLSGNTGHSTGSHLHISLKENGTFVDPDEYITTIDEAKGKGGFLDEHGGIIPKTIDKIKSNDNDDKGIIDSIGGFLDFIDDIRNEGLFHAIWGKSFFEVVKDFFKEFFLDIYDFILINGDAFFLCPAIVIMFLTFVMGRNKLTKWIVPLWFGYFATVILGGLRDL